MVLYNAVSGVKGFTEKAATFLGDLKERGDSMVSEEVWRGEQKLMACRGLAVLAKLYEKGYDGILAQIRQGLTYEPLVTSVDGLVLQIRQSPRWEKNFQTAALDIVMAVPKWERVIAFSTTDMVSDVDPSLIRRYEQLHIENFHFYPFFNRAHGVRGRRVYHDQACSVSAIMDNLQGFPFLLRTCNDAELIGKSVCLPAFTPVETRRGLQLAFYFSVVCRVTSADAVRSATGFGADWGVTRLTLSDGQGEIKADVNTGIFSESLSLSCNEAVRGSIKDPFALTGYNGWTLVLCAWLFGQDIPSVAAIQFLGDRKDVPDLQFGAFMNTRRKVRLEPEVAEWKSRLSGAGGEPRSQSIVVEGEYAYFKSSEWSSRIFVSALKKGFKALNVSDITSTGASFKDCRDWERLFHTFAHVQPEVIRLYLSEDPKSALKEVFPSDPKGKRAEEDPLADLYKCTRCRMAFKGWQFPSGTDKRCTRCHMLLELFQTEDEQQRRRAPPSPRRMKASRFLGSDPWLKSLFD